MLVTVTNQTAEEIELPYPFNNQSHHFVQTDSPSNPAFNTVKEPIKLGPNGGGSDSVQLGISKEDWSRGLDKGDAAWKALQKMVNEGTVTVAQAVDGNDNSIIDDANEVA